VTLTIRRGSMADALRAARAEVVVWSAKDAGIEDLLKCGLRGSPTVVKRVFAPSARAEKAKLIELQPSALETADGLIAEVFGRLPALETELVELHQTL
jgi:electron transfer flavoprotein beta subunit